MTMPHPLPDTVEHWPIDRLILCVRNARTHSDEQVARIAASIRELGWTNPVLVDGDNGVIAGHGRILAARKLGLDTVPVIELAHLTPVQRRNGMKDVICADCGAEFNARKDTSPTVCKRCASIRGGRAMKGAQRAERKPCPVCGTPILLSRDYTYCSVRCRTSAKRLDRTCKHCGQIFTVLMSAISGKTNASAHFCSRQCYEAWLCHGDRTSGRGSRWRAIRHEALRRQPYCALCGRLHGLQVHHIVPFRLTHDNNADNLIALCPRHHKLTEYLTVNAENTGVSHEDIKLVMSNMLGEHRMATAFKIKMAMRMPHAAR